MDRKTFLQGKKVLVAGLGLFGGGEATAKWLLKQGADVAVTDLKTEEELASTLRKFTKSQKSKICFILGRHRMNDFREADIVVVNPGIPRESEYLKAAKAAGAKFENVASLFFRGLENSSIGITGTRGKSTTSSFIADLLSKKYGKVYAIGSSDRPLLGEMDSLEKNKNLPAVVELSSWQLELLPESKSAPHVAIITNLYRDHLNRYRGMTDYANAKASIFRYQTKNDFLILNADNEWGDYFQKKNPRSRILYFSKKPLPKKKDGVFLSKAGTLWMQKDGKERKFFSLLEFERKYGRHNLENLLAAFLAVQLSFPDISITKRDNFALREVPFRQEEVFCNKQKLIINDSASTMPDAVIVAINRFSKEAKKQDFFLITGGTDKRLVFDVLAREIKKRVLSQNLILLEGSATTKLVRELAIIDFPVEKSTMCCSLGETVEAAKEKMKGNKKSLLVFSPGAASFEKFQNEFDRGRQFNDLVIEYFGK